MNHKAFNFDWSRFEYELYPILLDALTTNDATQLEAFIDQNRTELIDPYGGEPLLMDWRTLLENRDVQEYGDFALTRFYDLTDCWGIGDKWMTLSQELPKEAADALLGFPVGPPAVLFDPGRYGSYFQTPALVQEFLSVLRPFRQPELAKYLSLLERCTAEQRGVYVTF